VSSKLGNGSPGHNSRRLGMRRDQRSYWDSP